MRFRPRRGVLVVLSVVLAVGLAACGGSIPPPETDTEGIRPAGQGRDPQAPEVEVFASSDRFIIEDFRIDFAKMRNIYSLMGFFPDQWEKMETVPFTEIHEFQLRSVVDSDTFERIYRGREEFQLNPQEIFRVAITTRNGENFDYIAIIPRLRGFRNTQRWEQQMAGNPAGIQRIVMLE